VNLTHKLRTTIRALTHGRGQDGGAHRPSDSRWRQPRVGARFLRRHENFSTGKWQLTEGPSSMDAELLDKNFGNNRPFASIVATTE